MGSRDPRWRGIYRHGAGWRATVSRGRGVPPLLRHFPKDTDPREMQAWRADEKAQLRLTRKARATSGTFEFDAKRYLAAITAMPSLAERTADIARWVAIFGTRRRDTITAADIRGVRDRWMTEPRGYTVSATGQIAPQPPYAASTINHRLRALSNLWTVLDGRRAQNPVRDVPEVPEPDPLPRAIPYPVIEQILAAMPDRGRPTKGRKNVTVSLAKLRLRVIAYTGLTYSQLGRLTAEDVDLVIGSMLVRRRRKGKGAKSRLQPLLPEAIEAFRQLDAANGWGAFSGASVRKSFVLAVGKLKKAGVPLNGVRVYDLRHTFAGLVFRATRSREAVKDLLQHESLRTTERYVLSAVSDVLHEQMAKTSQLLTPKKPTTP